MSFLQTGTFGLILIAALGYSIATVGMKIGSTGLTVTAVLLMAGGLFAAAAAEVVILKSADLGIVFITIIGIETLIVLTYAAMIGEGLDLRQLGGAGMVLAGIAVVSH
jgi:small multidrug resistance pump